MVLGDGIWRRRFGANANVLGQTLGLNGVPHTIVGVLPPGFAGLTGQADIWVPVMTRGAGDLGETWNHSYSVVARRREAVTPEQADAASRLLGADVSAQFAPPGATPGWAGRRGARRRSR